MAGSPYELALYLREQFDDFEGVLAPAAGPSSEESGDGATTTLVERAEALA